MTDFNPITGRADSVYFMGLATPGLAVVEGNSGSPRKWSERGGYGLSGCTVVFTGAGLAKFDVIISLYTKDDWAAWHAFLPILAPPPKGIAALAVYHPYLAMLKITQCVILDISIPKTDDYGVTEVIVYCQSFRPAPKITLLKPESAKATPTDPIERLIASRSVQIRSLELRDNGLARAQAEALAQAEDTIQRGGS